MKLYNSDFMQNVNVWKQTQLVMNHRAHTDLEVSVTIYVVGSKVSGLTYKNRAKWKMLPGIYSAIYGEVSVSVSGGYVLQYAGGTRASRTCCAELLQCQKSSTVW